MEAFEIMEELFSLGVNRTDYSVTCDTCKAGSPEKEVKKIAVSMFATPELVKRASAWGADLLIVHEPTYYNHMDEHSDEKLECEKRALIESTGITIYRFHDHAHAAAPDMIVAGEEKYMQLDAKVESMDGFDCLRLVLNHAMTAREVAAHLEKTLGIRHIRICGAADVPCTRVTGMFGTPGGVFDELKSEQCEILMTGEATEWKLDEYARDAAQLGHKKALLVLGHIGSERAGMQYVCDYLRKTHPELECEYFECGEVYTYTDCQ